MSEHVYWIWLAQRPEFTARQLNQLYEQMGTPAHLYAADRAAYIAVGLNARQTAALCDKDLTAAYAILRTCEKQNIQILTREDSGYPAALKEIDDPPLVLYVRGALPNFTLSPALTIVGTRSCSPYGLRMAERFGEGLARAGFTVLSGMALGIDSAAHRGCLKGGGRTVAVLAGGVDICYPAQNRRLMDEILHSGAVLSENPPGTENAGFRFPIRNRILSGMAAATLVVEAPLRSGALITARRAFDQGREVFAVPGPIDANASKGCNRLIRDECARIVTEPLDIVHELADMLGTPPQEELVRRVWERETGEPEADLSLEAEPETPDEKKDRKPGLLGRLRGRPAAPRPLPETLSPDEQRVAQALADGADSVDAVVQQTGMEAGQVSAALVLLELDGYVEQKGGHYRRTP